MPTVPGFRDKRRRNRRYYYYYIVVGRRIEQIPRSRAAFYLRFTGPTTTYNARVYNVLDRTYDIYGVAVKSSGRGDSMIHSYGARVFSR